LNPPNYIIIILRIDFFSLIRKDYLLSSIHEREYRGGNEGVFPGVIFIKGIHDDFFSA